MLLQEMREELVTRGLASTETEVCQVLQRNKYFLCALDNALSRGCGLSLADFVASPRCKALDVHEEVCHTLQHVRILESFGGSSLA